MVESQPSKLLVAGSIPVSRSKKSAVGSRRWAVNVLRHDGLKGVAVVHPSGFDALTADCPLPTAR